MTPNHPLHDPADPLPSPGIHPGVTTSQTTASSPTTVLILGATSAIGRAIAHQWAAHGHRLLLAARDTEELEKDAADLRLRHRVDVATLHFDATKFDEHPALVDAATTRFDTGLDAAVLVHGYLPDQSQATADVATARQAIDVNYTSAVSLLTPLANYFESRGKGTIIAVTSVAGDRGRQSNYVYGSAKAALTTYMEGLWHRLAKRGITVLTVKPGFVDTAMTWGLPGVFLAADPATVARDVYRAVRRRRRTIYTPWFWRWIMLIIRTVPAFLFKRTKL